MTTPEPAVDLELIAALIDGRLTPADRERAIQMLATSDVAFRLGVRTFDLQIAVSQNDRETADDLMAEMLEWISTLPFSEVIAARYRELRRLLMAGRQREQLLADAAQAESALGELLGGRPDDSFWFNFGKWSAAAELAASVHSRPFFQSDLTGRVVRDALARVSVEHQVAPYSGHARGRVSPCTVLLQRSGNRAPMLHSLLNHDILLQFAIRLNRMRFRGSPA